MYLNMVWFYVFEHVSTFEYIIISLLCIEGCFDLPCKIYNRQADLSTKLEFRKQGSAYYLNIFTCEGILWNDRYKAPNSWNVGLRKCSDVFTKL